MIFLVFGWKIPLHKNLLSDILKSRNNPIENISYFEYKKNQEVSGGG